MNGIVFFHSAALEEVVEFHTQELGGVVWLEQTGCTIVRHGNLLAGFCRAEQAQTDGLITLFAETREEVDEYHGRLCAVAAAAPRFNDAYGIYHFYAVDPEGRPLEIQCFDERPPLGEWEDMC